jgi:2-(1,2-epoxy-1,2-dihydrophenyl)acetyl-CoA isomerase
MSDPLLVDRTEGVVTLTFNRPDSLNSLDAALREQFRDTLAALDTDPGCRAVVLHGAGRAFCVGQDLREHVEVLEKGTSDPMHAVREHYNPIAARLGTLSRPVVAAVRGMAAGAGASIACLADFRIGGSSTRFLMAFANVGLAGDTGISWSLPRLVGHAKATELLLLAEPIDADEAQQIGLLTGLIVDDSAVLGTAQELAARLAAGPTVAYAAIKRELAVGGAGSLADALAAEEAAQQRTAGTADHRSSTMAFVRKQRPTFTGT